jgi:hypothetical protein
VIAAANRKQRAADESAMYAELLRLSEEDEQAEAAMLAEFERLSEADRKRELKSGRTQIQSAGLRGKLEGKKVYVGTRYGAMGEIIHPNGLRNWHYEAFYFLKEPVVKELAAPALAPWLNEQIHRATQKLTELWRKGQKKELRKFAPTIFVRYGTWVKNPQTNEYRKAFDTAVSRKLAQDIEASDIVGLISPKYWDEGYLLAGIEIYFYTAPA